MPERSLVIKVTAGKDDPERFNQAFTVAAAAVASGVPVSLWLTGESAWFGLPGRAEDFSLPHAAPLADLLAGVLAAGSVTVCPQCAARRSARSFCTRSSYRGSTGGSVPTTQPSSMSARAGLRTRAGPCR